MNVRAKAAGLLGSLHSVSVRFLEQTLDKKLMSQLRVGSTITLAGCLLMVSRQSVIIRNISLMLAHAVHLFKATMY